MNPQIREANIQRGIMGGMEKGFKYSLSDAAYTKAVMHAAQHIGSVHGLLLARPPKDNLVEIVDVLPVAHSSLACQTSPLTDMALRLASAHADLVSLDIVGAYYAPEVADDGDIPVLPTRLADLIRGVCEHACLLVMDASRLHPEIRVLAHCFKLYTREGGPASWGKGLQDSTDLVVSRGVLRSCHRRLLNLEEDPKDVVDFEDHCLDPSQQWISI